MTHEGHRSAITTCKRPCPSGMATFGKSHGRAWAALAGRVAVRAGRRRRRWDHG